MDQLRKTAAEKNCNLSGDGSGVGRRQEDGQGGETSMTEYDNIS